MPDADFHASHMPQTGHIFINFINQTRPTFYFLMAIRGFDPEGEKSEEFQILFKLSDKFRRPQKKKCRK
jgi:hypothetical protein